MNLLPSWSWPCHAGFGITCSRPWAVVAARLSDALSEDILTQSQSVLPKPKGVMGPWNLAKVNSLFELNVQWQESSVERAQRSWMREKHYRIYCVVQNMEPELTGLETHLAQRERQVFSCRSQAGVTSLPWFYPSTSNWQLGRVLERSFGIRWWQGWQNQQILSTTESQRLWI